MRDFVFLGSLCGAVIFGFNAFTRPKRSLLWPATLLALLAANEGYTDFVWEKHVVAPIRIDLLVTPFIVLALLVWGTILLLLTPKKQA